MTVSFERKSILAAFMLMAFSLPAFAMIGDGDEIIDSAYGNLVKRHLYDDGTVGVMYHKDRYLYRVTFKDLRSVSEEYSRADGKDLSPKEIKFFLKANGGWGQWIPNTIVGQKKWLRGDHKVEAAFVEDEAGRSALRVSVAKTHDRP